jgi:hypothetical protein
VTDDGEEIERNEVGIPLDVDGRPLSKNNKDEFVYVPVGVHRPDEIPAEARPTAGRPVDQVLGSESAEQIPLTTPVALPGSAVTASSSRIIVVGPQGSLLPTDDTGHFITAEGRQVSVNDEGLPVDEDGIVLPSNDLGEFVYVGPTVQRTTAVPAPRPTVIVVGPEGQLLPTDKSGIFVGPGGITFPTNNLGVPVGPDASPLPTNEIGHYIAQVGSREDDGAMALPTDDYGKEIYPIVDTAGESLPTDPASGRHIAANGEVIPVDEFGRPLNEDGSLLPVNREGQYVYIPPTTTTTTTTTTSPPPEMLPTLEEIVPIPTDRPTKVGPTFEITLNL